MAPALSVSGLKVAYGKIPAVHNATLEIMPGELRVILGANGAGKTTILKSILGLLKPSAGRILLAGEEISGRSPQDIHRLGVSWVPEARQLWGNLTVLDNLRLGGFHASSRRERQTRVEAMLDRFPRLRERAHQLAGSLSGGEQQMVAVARALVSRPRVLLMDEPSLGLAPLIVDQIFELAREINNDGVSILLVEQNAKQALKFAKWGYLLEIGSIVAEGSPTELAASKAVQDVFLGGSI